MKKFLRKLLATRKRRVLTASAVILLTPIAGVLAYFAAHGSGTVTSNAGKVTSTSPVASWNVTLASTTSGGALAPGNGALDETQITVTNSGTTVQSAPDGASAFAVSVASSGGNIIDGGTPVAGCLASWFTPGLDDGASGTVSQVPVGATLQSVDHQFIYATVTMPADATDEQSACLGHNVALTVVYTS
jgi:hypothetical protein